MNKTTYKVTDKKNIITLTEKEYKAAGGQGVVFCKGDLAYKIYHDPQKMIPEAKIQELSELKRDNILGPISTLYDYTTNKPIGFTMKFVKDIEFLCQIFTKNFKDSKGINQTNIVSLITEMQKTLQYIHDNKILVVDYNEMNFLLDKMITTVFHIDVDSWQTKNFKVNAIMESIRDRTTDKFTELSDWFAWAVVTFQMYTGIHPYKGKHPKFKPDEWSKRMDLGISVFDKDVILPKICQDFSVIPKAQLDWYKLVFQKNERSIPPFADDTVSGIITRKIGSSDDFIIKEIVEMEKQIRSIFYLNNKRYILTSEGIYDNNKNVFAIKKSAKSFLTGMCEVFNDKPLVVQLIDNLATFYDLNGSNISSIQAEDMMGYNNILYTINNNHLIENTFERIGKIVHMTKNICNIGSSYKMFKGVVVQDDFMVCHLAIPFEKDKCVNIHVKELDGYRIVDAKYDKRICIVIAEKLNKYLRFFICFNADHSKYTIRVEDILNFHLSNFIVLPNNYCISIDDEKLIIFIDNIKRKEITNCPFDASVRLYNEQMQVLFVDDKKLYYVTMK